MAQASPYGSYGGLPYGGPGKGQMNSAHAAVDGLRAPYGFPRVARAAGLQGLAGTRRGGGPPITPP